MADRKDDKNLTPPAALKQWREAERVTEVANRGTVAARNAAAAAKTGAKAADATAKASRTALIAVARAEGATAKASKAAVLAAARAEGSAARTARAAKTMVAATFVEAAHAQSDDESAREEEVAAHGRYRDAVTRASDPREPNR